jgi:hypothetical protein
VILRSRASFHAMAATAFPSTCSFAQDSHLKYCRSSSLPTMLIKRAEVSAS